MVDVAAFHKIPPSDLTNAAYQGNYERVKFLIENNQHDYNHCLAMYYATEQGHLDIVRYIIEKYEEIRPFDKSGLIETAAANGRLGMIQYLCDNSENITITQEAMINAIKGGYLTVLKYLIKMAFPDINVISNLLEQTAHYGQFEIFQYLMKFGIKGRYTLLNDACIGGNLDIVKYLVEHGYTGTESIMKTCIYNNNLDIIKYLNENISFNEWLTKNSMWLNLAVAFGHFDIVRYFWSLTCHKVCIYNHVAFENQNQKEIVNFLTQQGCYVVGI